MASGLTRDAFKTPDGRRRAWRELMLDDHGALRKCYRNEHEVAAGELWRSYQPSPADVARWARMGIRTIVNLRGAKPSGFLFLEEEACAQHGVALETFRVFSREAPSPETLCGARALFDRIEYPAVIHCKSGADRAGLMATLYLFFRKGRPLNEAMRQLSWRYGHIRQGKTGVIDYALDLYKDYATRREIALDDVEAFLQWAQSDAYDPTAVKAAFASSWWGALLTERILRRE